MLEFFVYIGKRKSSLHKRTSLISTETRTLIRADNTCSCREPIGSTVARSNQSPAMAKRLTSQTRFYTINDLWLISAPNMFCRSQSNHTRKGEVGANQISTEGQWMNSVMPSNGRMGEWSANTQPTSTKGAKCIKQFLDLGSSKLFLIEAKPFIEMNDI